MDTKRERRFWAKVEKTDECWLWTGGTSRHGYGEFHNPGGERRAHRLSWELLVGPIRPGGWVLHLCDVPACVRPEHLFLGDAATNNRDMARKGRHPNQRKTHCPKGHEYAGANLYVRKKTGGRTCRTCQRSSMKRYYARTKP